ncbi:MAG: OmpA family protein [Bacteroidetes bacterium]|nr:OmpA family protein [Bacteroidota bacterium]
MKTFFKLGLGAMLLSLSIQSCIVSKRKYDDMLAQKVKAEGELAEKSDQLNKANADISALNDKLTHLKEDTTSLGEQKRATARKIADLTKEYDQLSAYYKNLLNSSGKLNRDMQEQKEQLLAIQANLDRTRHQNDSLSTSLLEREQKVRELETVLANKDKAVMDLKNRISNALLNFKENDLTVNVKNGKVYVSLPEQLLFQSGSIDVDQKGVLALQQLAKAIKDQKDIHIMVEGHTDNVPIGKKSQYMQDNWDLSVMRATAITKILTKAGVTPNQITAAGKGEFQPILPNSSDGNKQKNRRTELIITPNLDELFKILEAN